MKLRILLAIMFALVLSGQVLAAEGDGSGSGEETTSNSMLPGDQNNGGTETTTPPAENQAPAENNAGAGTMQQ